MACALVKLSRSRLILLTEGLLSADSRPSPLNVRTFPLQTQPKRLSALLVVPTTFLDKTA